LAILPYILQKSKERDGATVGTRCEREGRCGGVSAQVALLRRRQRRRQRKAKRKATFLSFLFCCVLSNQILGAD